MTSATSARRLSSTSRARRLLGGTRKFALGAIGRSAAARAMSGRALGTMSGFSAVLWGRSPLSERAR